MTTQRLVGMIVFIVGALACYLGYQDASSDFGTKILDGYIDTSRYYLYGGATAAIAGAVIALVARRA